MTVEQGLDPHFWVKNHADYLYAFAITRVNDEDTAKDLVQETFLAALEKVRTFEGKSTERTWLTAILRYKIIDIYRKRSSGLNAVAANNNAENEQHDLFEDNGHWTPEHAPSPFGHQADENLNNKEFKRVLQNCMQKLPALWMSVFTMKHMDEESTETICQALKVTTANYWVIIHRTKLNLRACLQKNWI